MASKNKTEKTVETKAAKVLSPKRQTELDHTLGKHAAVDVEGCGFCIRRTNRRIRRHGR